MAKKPKIDPVRAALEARIIAHVSDRLALEGITEIDGVRFSQQFIARRIANHHHRILIRHEPDTDNICWVATISYPQSGGKNRIYRPTWIGANGNMEIYNRDLTILRMHID